MMYCQQITHQKGVAMYAVADSALVQVLASRAYTILKEADLRHRSQRINQRQIVWATGKAIAESRAVERAEFDVTCNAVKHELQKLINNSGTRNPAHALF